jgi:hypothetical protein
MAQGLVTYLGGAVKPSMWLEAASNPSSSFHFFDDCLEAIATTYSASAAAVTGAGKLYGRITTSAAASTASTTTLRVLFKDPEKVAFEVKGAFLGDGTGGVVGVSDVASDTRTNLDSSLGAYFFVDSGGLKFRVRRGASTDNTTVAVPFTGAITDERRYGFTFEGGLFRVFINGAEAAEFRSIFPSADMRFTVGKSSAITAVTNDFRELDYVMISVPRA